MELQRYARSWSASSHASSEYQAWRQAKQQQWRFRPNIMEAIEAEVYKLIACGFIQEEQHLDWVANIIPVLKKNGKF